MPIHFCPTNPCAICESNRRGGWLSPMPDPYVSRYVHITQTETETRVVLAPFYLRTCSPSS